MRTPTFTLSQAENVVTVDQWPRSALICRKLLDLGRDCPSERFSVTRGRLHGCSVRFRCANGSADYVVVCKQPGSRSVWRMELSRAFAEAPAVPAEEGED